MPKVSMRIGAFLVLLVVLGLLWHFNSKDIDPADLPVIETPTYIDGGLFDGDLL